MTPVHVSSEILVAIARPFDRQIELGSSPHHEHFFGVDLPLEPERATDVIGLYFNGVSRYAKAAGNKMPYLERILGGRNKRESTVPSLVESDGRSRLDRTAIRARVTDRHFRNILGNS